MNITILSAIWPAAVEALQARHACRVALSPAPGELPGVLREAEVAVLRSGVRLDRAALEVAPQLRLIVRAGMGLESIDRDCAGELGIRVVCVLAATAGDVIEIANIANNTIVTATCGLGLATPATAVSAFERCRQVGEKIRQLSCSAFA